MYTFSLVPFSIDLFAVFFPINFSSTHVARFEHFELLSYFVLYLSLTQFWPSSNFVSVKWQRLTCHKEKHSVRLIFFNIEFFFSIRSRNARSVKLLPEREKENLVRRRPDELASIRVS